MGWRMLIGRRRLGRSVGGGRVWPFYLGLGRRGYWWGGCALRRDGYVREYSEMRVFLSRVVLCFDEWRPRDRSLAIGEL